MMGIKTTLCGVAEAGVLHSYVRLSFIDILRVSDALLREPLTGE